MSAQIARAAGVLVIVLAGPPALAQETPLPKGALQRLGTFNYVQEVRVSDFAFAPDGKRYATVANTAKDGSVRVWQTATGKVLLRCDAPYPLIQVAFAPDGKAVAAASDFDLFIWDGTTGKLLRHFPEQQGGVGCIAWAPDGKTLAVGGSPVGGPDHTIRQLDALTGKVVRIFAKHLSYVSVLQFSADGTRLASSSTDRAADGDSKSVAAGMVCVWEVATGKKLHQVDRSGGLFYGRTSIAFAADLGRVAWVTGPEPAVQVWDVAAGKRLAALERKGWPACPTLAFAPDGKKFFTGLENWFIAAWHAETGEVVGNFAGTGSHGLAIAGLDPAGKCLATVNVSDVPGRIRLWDVTTGKELTTQQVHRTPLVLTQLTADGKYVVTAEREQAVCVWDRGTGQVVKHLAGLHVLPSAGEALRGNGNLACHNGYTLQIVEVTTGKRVFDADHLLPEYPTALAWSPDQRWLVMSRTGNADLFDIAKRKVRSTLPGNCVLAFGPDSGVLVTAAKEPQLWAAASGKELVAFHDVALEELARKFGRTYFQALAVSLDGRWLASSDDPVHNQATIRLWEMATGRLVLTLAELPHRVDILAFTPDGTRLVACSADDPNGERSATFWDLASGQRVGGVNGHFGGVSTFAFAPDGRTFLTGGHDSTTLLWDVAALPRAKPAAPRQLTAKQLDALWEQLGGTNGRQAYQAMVALSTAGKDAIAFLQKYVPPAKLLSAAELQQALADLDDQRYAVRAKTTAVLEAQGEYAANALRQVLQKPGLSLELRQRAEALLVKLEQYVPPPAELRQLRGLAALEKQGSPAARAVVEALAGGSAEARLTQHARAALARWPKAGG
jgi:WD40 repeat protein